MMKSPANLSGLHEETQQLLPWYINQTLSPEQDSLVEQHLQQCLICRRDWLDLQKLAAKIIAPTELEATADASFGQLLAKLNPPVALSKAKPLKQRRYQVAAMLSFGLAASFLLLLMPSLPTLQHTFQVADYHTLSAERTEPSHGNLLKVVFAPGLPNQRADDLLAKIHGRRIDQANSAGAFTIQLDADGGLDIDQALAILRRHDEVLLAEPWQRP